MPPILAEKKKRSKYRPMVQRDGLAARLRTWTTISHSDDPVFRSWPQDWILPDESINLLARAKAGDFATPRDITTFLHENNDWHDSWADEIHSIICDYNMLIITSKSKIQQSKVLGRMIENNDNSMGPESEDEPDEGEHNKDNADDERELHDNPQDDVETVRGQYGPSEDLQTATHSRGPSRPPSPDLVQHSLRRARTVTPPESPSSKAPPRPTKRTKLNTTTNTYRRSSRLRKQ